MLPDFGGVTIPKSEGSSYKMETIRVEYEWKPSKFDKYNGKSMDVSVDDTWKKVEAPPKITPRKTGI
ncbi:hypothetical protein Tco_0841740 [Tanacetum coccineum]|uniref:Uncharacterized protein n=1 Tax=Tanacetum coccineum TaxID=301880 RepID=A0ABQ5B141_9ASTR